MSSLINEWCKKDNLILLEGWARDGNTMSDIALRIGVDASTLAKWKDKNEDIREALEQGKEIVDYKVENALLRSALGYKTKETTVRVLMRGGVIIEKEKSTVTKEQAPNVNAIQMWLYNRQKTKWKNMNNRANIIDELETDTDIQITVTRAKQNELEDDKDKEWIEEVNNTVSVKDAIEKEKQEKQQEKKKSKNKPLNGTFKGKNNQENDFIIENDKTDSLSVKDGDLDYWPDDWEEKINE